MLHHDSKIMKSLNSNIKCYYTRRSCTKVEMNFFVSMDYYCILKFISPVSALKKLKYIVKLSNAVLTCYHKSL